MYGGAPQTAHDPVSSTSDSQSGRPMSWSHQLTNSVTRFFSPNPPKQATYNIEGATNPHNHFASYSSDQGQSTPAPSSRKMAPNQQRRSSNFTVPSTSVRTAKQHRDRSSEYPRMKLSELSSDAIPNSVFGQPDFLLGAGMVILEQDTWKVVVIQDGNYWFFPKGRKDVGESLEQAALREAYEESGYRAAFFPLYNQTRQPPAPEDRISRSRRNTEAIYISTYAWQARRGPLEYLTHWYVGIIPQNAPHTLNTGMEDEKGFKTHLLYMDEAYKLVGEVERRLLFYVRDLLQYELHHGAEQDELVRRLEQEALDGREAVEDVF